MRDLDLIPQEYRERKTAVAQLRRFALLGVTLIVAMVLGHVWLGWAVTEEQQDITRLENGKQQALGMRQNMDRLNERRDLLAKQLDTLDKLRSGPTIVTGFHSIDQALDQQVWFRNWEFNRSGERNGATPSERSGYFIVTEGGEGEAQPWEGQTVMIIQGHALTHMALSQFVLRLNRQASIEDVKVLSTNLRRYTQTEVVDFKLAVLLSNRGRS